MTTTRPYRDAQTKPAWRHRTRATHTASTHAGTCKSCCMVNNFAMMVTHAAGLPNAMVYLGWPAGVVIMTLSWVATLYTLYQMCAMHEVQGR